MGSIRFENDGNYECSWCGIKHGATVLDCPITGDCVYADDPNESCECKLCMKLAYERDEENE